MNVVPVPFILCYWLLFILAVDCVAAAWCVPKYQYKVFFVPM